MPHTVLFASIRPGYEGNTNEDQEKVVNALKESVENLNKEAKAAGLLLTAFWVHGFDIQIVQVDKQLQHREQL